MFKQIRPKKISEIVIEQIRDEIIKGSLKPGEKIPTERELAETMGVSRPPIREAIKQLIYGGFLETRQGDGTYVKSITGGMFSDPLKEQIQSSKTSFLELAKIRELLECWACREAAENRTEEQLQQLQEVVQKMKKLPKLEIFLKLDLDFHRILAEMTQNTIYQHLSLSIGNLLIPLFMKYHGKIFPDKQSLNQLYQVHEKIVDAIKLSDPPAAHEAMKEHISYIVEIRHQMEG